MIAMLEADIDSLISSRVECAPIPRDELASACIALLEQRGEAAQRRAVACCVESRLAAALQENSSTALAVEGEWCTASLPVDLEARLSAFAKPLVSASSKDEYLAALGACGSCTFPLSFFGSRRLAPPTEHQNIRDVERDALLFNGRLLVGAEEGYTAIVEILCQALREAEESSPMSCSRLAEVDAVSFFAREILSRGNRTNSGGNAYDVLERYVRSQELALITPASERASPFEVEISCGPFRRSSGSLDFGLRALVTGTTHYRLTDPDPVDEITPHFAKVATTFRQRLVMSLPSRLQGERRLSHALDEGTVDVSIAVLTNT